MKEIMVEWTNSMSVNWYPMHAREPPREVIRLLHTPRLSEIASGGDSQRSGLNCSARVINSFSERRRGMIEYILKLESVVTPDIFIRVHRVNWNKRPVPFAHSVRQLVRLDQIPEGLLRYRGGNYLIGDPSFMGKTVSLMVCLLTTNTGE